MRKGKIKVFLGAYINQTNAQNINCRQIALHLDKSKFDVFTLSIQHGDLPKIVNKSIRVFNCFYPVKLTGPLGYLWGMWQADVVYLPRVDFLKWQLFLLKVFKVKSFKTIENIVDDVALKTALLGASKVFNDPLDYYRYCDKNHPITSFVGDYNLRHHNLKFDLPILPVPTDISYFQQKYHVRKKLENVIFVGNGFKRKGLTEFINLANAFPTLKFTVVGEGNFAKFAFNARNPNVHYMGLQNHESLLEILHETDLHFFPSKSEGFGKVTIECAAMGIPSIIYDSYGAREWINDDEAYIVSSYQQVEGIVAEILNDSKEFSRKSSVCPRFADRFSPENVVPAYEEVIEDLYSVNN